MSPTPETSSANEGAGDKPAGPLRIIGIGQSMRGDDAAGLAAVRLWQGIYQAKDPHRDVQVELAESPGIGLLDLLEGASIAILVDAVRSGAKPGRIHIVPAEKLAAFTAGTGSVHGWGVAETLALGKQLQPAKMPQQLVLIGIEAGDVSPGESLTFEVERALPMVALLVELLVTQESSPGQGSSTSPRISPR